MSATDSAVRTSVPGGSTTDAQLASQTVRVARSNPPTPTHLAALESRIANLEAKRQDGIAIIMHSNDLDRVLAAMTVANGAAMMGTPVKIFFAFWGVSVLRAPQPPARKRTWLARVFGWMLPSGSDELQLSKMHMGGMGTAMMKGRMQAAEFPSVREQLATAVEAGVELYVCDTSLDMLGLAMSDLDPGLGIEICGVATFVHQSLGCQHSMLF